MKAIPSLFVGLAVLSAGCRAYNLQPPPSAIPRPDPGLAATLETAPPPTTEAVAAATSDPDGAATVVELGRATSTPPRPLAEPADASGTAQSTLPDGWRAAYESHERRPIHTLQLGAGGPRVFVTASLHGDDAESVRLIDAVATRLTDATPASACLFVRSPNPDGLAAGRRWNSNGVDLNRNFPTLRFVPQSDGQHGEPASETETRVILRVLGEFRPDRVIQVRTSDVETVRAYANVAADIALGDVLDELRFERGRFQEVAAAGSLEEFASSRLRAETMTVIIPASTARQPEVVDALLALCTGRTETTPERTPDRPAPAAIAESDAADAPAALTGILEPIGQDGAGAGAGADGAHGYVELLPPPPDSESDRSGFHELTPPS